MTIRLDYTNMMSGAVPGALDEALWLGAVGKLHDAHAAARAMFDSGDAGFLELPHDPAPAAACEAFAASVHGRFHDVVVLGIGGSALGPIALRTSLLGPGWNLMDAAARNRRPRLHVLDNVDPRSMRGLLDFLDLSRTLFVVTSKSGGTAETMAQFLVVRGRLLDSGLEPREHLVFVTDPKRGALRAIAEAESVRAFDIPANVGGRFSVLSPVGLLPAALVGIDVHGLLRGAGELADRCRSADPGSNIAAAFAALHWLADTRLGRPMHVLMPYSDALRDMADWFVQLWAESLGKVTPAGESVGPTPIAALGATDQHSQVQLFMEGPADKTVCFLAVAEPGADVPIPTAYPDMQELAYLGGHTLGQLLDVERRATAGALARRGRPNMTLTLDTVDAEHVGGLFMLLELATAYAGSLYGVDAFNQPGVELGKQFAYAMLGRPDADEARAEWERLPRPDPRRTL